MYYTIEETYSFEPTKEFKEFMAFETELLKHNIEHKKILTTTNVSFVITKRYTTNLFDNDEMEDIIMACKGKGKKKK